MVTQTRFARQNTSKNSQKYLPAKSLRFVREPFLGRQRLSFLKLRGLPIYFASTVFLVFLELSVVCVLPLNRLPARELENC